jgi:AcrR family transcriptional regulator
MGHPLRWFGMDAAGQADPGPAPTLRADAARNRRSVIETARRQVAAGDLTLPMNTIAREAGVGVGTVYRHFPTRQALLETVAAGAFQALVEEAQKAAAEPDPEHALEGLLRFAVRLLATDRGFAALLACPTFECPETLQMGTALGESITQVLDRARQAGLIRADISADDLRRLMSGLDQALKSGSDEASKIDLYLNVLILGLRPRAEGPPPGRKLRRSSTSRLST